MNYNMSGMAAQGEILILLRILIAGNPANRQRSGKVGLYHILGIADTAKDIFAMDWRLKVAKRKKVGGLERPPYLSLRRYA